MGSKFKPLMKTSLKTFFTKQEVSAPVGCLPAGKGRFSPTGFAKRGIICIYEIE